MQHYTVYFIWKTALHVSGGISTHHQEHTQLYLQYLIHVKPLLLHATHPQLRQEAVTVKHVPDTVNTVVCAPDDGWRYHPKHVEQFSRNKYLNCVMLYIVGNISKGIYLRCTDP